MDTITHGELPIGECPCEACDCFPSDCCVEFFGSFYDDGMNGCIPDGTAVLYTCNGLACDPGIDACIETEISSTEKFCEGDFMTFTMTTHGINNGGTGGGVSPIIGIAASYFDCPGSTWGIWRVADYSPTGSGGPVVTEGAGGASVEWQGYDPDVGFPDNTYRVTFWWDPAGDCGAPSELCGNYLVTLYSAAGRVGENIYEFEGSDPRTCDVGPTEPVESVDENGTPVITMPTQVVRVPLEDCPCDCYEEDPCECPTIENINIWANIVAKRLNWSEDTSGTGTLWLLLGMAQGVITSGPYDCGPDVTCWDFSVNDPINANQTSFTGTVFCDQTLQYTQLSAEIEDLWDHFGVLTGGGSDCPSTSCYPKKYLHQDYNAEPSTHVNYGQLVVTNNPTPNYNLDEGKDVPDCCLNDVKNLTCPAMMCASFDGAYNMSRLAECVDPDGDLGCGGSRYYVFSASTEEDSAIAPLADGFSLFPGWGPSNVPRPGGARQRCSVGGSVLLCEGHKLIVRGFANQTRIETGSGGPGFFKVSIWTGDATFSIPIGSRASVCDFFPLTINIPIKKWVFDHPNPLVITNLPPMSVRFSFCDGVADRGNSEGQGSDWFFYMVENLGG